MASVFFDALITVDFSTLEPSILIEPVLAEELRPMAWVLVKVFLDALINVDFSIFEPSANAEDEAAAVKANASSEIDNVFMGFLRVVLKFEVSVTIPEKLRCEACTFDL
ncbi:protein of unknown function [Methylotuvimicrobium alcaliphilum 20Z]|uniref:Uncharacterized protein n=1 Tax=Methylotuvimicrobium alcaliphilum (strain DSM 19304 / NCIMB 14124 / VKM B-2133 / 20Z) TaxID=1091494 RepID=G4STR7_META2|nr:protein of unknown function [Methylotuvimicrobium alcaliphilum 20Z]